MVNRTSRQPDSAPPADPPAGPADGQQGGGPDPEAGRIKTLDERFGKIEAEQSRQGGVLQQILDKLPGGQPPPTDAGAGVGPAGSGSADRGPAGPPDIQGIVQREIAAAEQRRAEQDKARADQQSQTEQTVKEMIEKLRPEQTPREPQTGLRGRLQRITIGKLD